MRFNGKVAIITGAGQGLGAAFARELAREGAAVVLVGRTLEKLKKVEAEIDGKVLCCQADVSEEGQVAEVVKNTLDNFGTIDILINNAAVHKSNHVLETTLADWELQLKINLTGTFLCSKAVLPVMIEKQYGKILNISSSAAKHFFPGFAAYSASKAGIVSFTHTLSEEVKQDNINVNAIYLGMTNTEYTRQRMNSDAAVTIPLDEMLQVDEVAKVVMFLVSDDASPIMGAAIDVFGKKA